MNKLMYVFGVIMILVIAILGYTYWFNKDTKTEVSVEATGVSILGVTFGLQEIGINMKGTFTSAKLDTGGIFLGEITLGEKTLSIGSETEGLRLVLKQDIFYGMMQTGEGESISCIFSTDFTTAYFINSTTGAYLYYPYQGERLMEVKGIVENAFKKTNILLPLY
ncbi:MAG TPA: hypothetical protein DCS67_10320 [Clostridiales bacterium UBA8960]|nr:hypothetical protein [Clostridiales bacterium UBA8960]